MLSEIRPVLSARGDGGGICGGVGRRQLVRAFCSNMAASSVGCFAPNPVAGLNCVSRGSFGRFPWLQGVARWLWVRPVVPGASRGDERAERANLVRVESVRAISHQRWGRVEYGWCACGSGGLRRAGGDRAPSRQLSAVFLQAINSTLGCGKWGMFPGTSLASRTDDQVDSGSSGHEWYTPAPRRARPADKCAERGRRRQTDTKCHQHVPCEPRTRKRGTCHAINLHTSTQPHALITDPSSPHLV